MDTVTFSDSAIDQIKISVEQTGGPGMGLRIAARMTADESVEYGMGFDEPRDDDIQFDIGGITILISPGDEELLHGAHVDFVELEPGKSNFIFLNPNDPNYKPPTEEGAIKED
ncbi:HesB/IscA family protein [Kaarinaea lacus]